MTDGFLDRVIAFSDRHRRVLMIVGMIWFALSWADTSRFINLPEIPLLTGTAAIIASSIYNAIWWGFLNPRIEQRRKALAATTSTAGAQNG